MGSPIVLIWPQCWIPPHDQATTACIKTKCHGLACEAPLHGFMLPKQHRFSSRDDFVQARKRGRSFSHPYFFFNIAKNTKGTVRFAISIPVRISKKATARNRLRRQLSAICFHELPHLCSGWDILIVGRPALLGQSFQNIQAAARSLFSRARLYPRTSPDDSVRTVRDSALTRKRVGLHNSKQ